MIVLLQIIKNGAGDALAEPQMIQHAAAILGAVSLPDQREEDPVPGRERFYRRDLDPRRYLRVVVDFNESPAFVVTAFIQDHPPGTTS